MRKRDCSLLCTTIMRFIKAPVVIDDAIPRALCRERWCVHHGNGCRLTALFALSLAFCMNAKKEEHVEDLVH